MKRTKFMRKHEAKKGIMRKSTPRTRRPAYVNKLGDAKYDSATIEKLTIERLKEVEKLQEKGKTK